MERDAYRAFAARLTTLRNIFGITQADLAERLGVSQSFLSHIARGSRPVPESLIFAASREFNLPLAFFLVQPRPEDQGQVTFRKNSRARARDEARVVGLYGEAARSFREISERSRYHPAHLPDPAEHGNDVEAIAREIRAAVNLDTEKPVSNAVRALERLGVGVVDNLDQTGLMAAADHSGLSRPSHSNSRPLVALVAELPGDVKRFTVLHELAHLIFDRDLAGPITSTRSEEERRAHAFAAAVLLPEEVVRKRVSETLNLHGYLPIKAEYGISVAATVIRARNLGVISHERARSLQIQMSSLGWRRNGEPVPVADETPVLLSQAIDRAFGRGKIANAALEVGTAPEWLARWTHTLKATGGSPPGAGVVVPLAARRRT